MSLSGRYRVYGEVYVDTGRDPQGVDGEVGEVGDGGHPEKPSRAHRAEHLTGSGVGRDDRASIGGDGPQGTALRATEQGADQEPRAPGAFGGGVDPLISRGRPGEQPVVSAGQQPPQPGGQQIEEVMPIHKNPGGLEASRQFVGRAVMPRAHTRRNDHDPRGGRRPRPDVGRRRGAHAFAGLPRWGTADQPPCWKGRERELPRSHRRAAVKGVRGRRRPERSACSGRSGGRRRNYYMM